MKFYISDTHFCHDNIIKFCNRPFDNSEQMNRTLIKLWNKKVSSIDEVYFLGDFAHKGEDTKIIEIVEQLNGIKYFVRGNHDKILHNKQFASHWQWIKDYAEVDDNGRRVILFHYPLEDWNGRFYHSFHLYGHIHNNTDIVNPNIENRYNVSADVTDLMPLSLDELIARNIKPQTTLEQQPEENSLGL